MNILLTNVYDLFNLGEVALVTSLVKNLPNVKFRIVSLYSFLDIKTCKKLGIKIYGRANPRPVGLLFFWFTLTLFRAFLWSILHRLFNINPTFLLNTELKAYLESDLIVDLGGDNFSDETGFGGSLVHDYSLLLGILLEKPFVICSQSIGPFRTHLTKSLAKYIMSKACLITVREPITFCYLRDNLGLKMDERLLVPDLAFLLEGTDFKETERFLMEKEIPIKMPIVCVNPSQLISKYMFPDKKTEKYERYISLMAKVIDRLPKDAVVLLLPNVIGRSVQVQGLFKNVDDRLAMKAVFEKLEDKSRVYLIDEGVDPHYIKGIFGLADLFIGCRMHATISALSTGCPTIALSYSHKTLGIVGELMGLKEFIVNVRHRDDLNALESELLAKIGDVWERRVSIKDVLQRESDQWKKSAMRNIELIEQCLTK